MSDSGGPQPRSYTTQEAARMLGISPASVQRWVDAGQLKAWKTMGGHRRIDGASLDTLLAAQRRGAPLQAAVPGTLRVLLVDDDPIARELLETQVRTLLPTARIETADNGFQALLAMGRQRPDLLITDLVMPHMNGLEMLHELRRSAAPRLILAVSSQGPDELRRLGSLPAGVPLLAKPVDQQALAAALQPVLQPG